MVSSKARCSWPSVFCHWFSFLFWSHQIMTLAPAVTFLECYLWATLHRASSSSVCHCPSVLSTDVHPFPPLPDLRCPLAQAWSRWSLTVLQLPSLPMSLITMCYFLSFPVEVKLHESKELAFLPFACLALGRGPGVLKVFSRHLLLK